MKCIFICVLLKAAVVLCQNSNVMIPVKEWKQLDFNFPSQQIRQDAIARGMFVQKNCFPIDVDVDYQVNVERTRIFVTIPRFSTGIPVTLGTVAPTIGALIQPYPDYSWHSSHGANCDGITSVLRIAIDECRRLWVLDTGKIGDIQKCPPQLLVFDLSTNLLISRYRFPKQQYSAASLFITPLVDVKDPGPYGRCMNTKVYIADVTGFALIVYDFFTNKSWKIQNNLFLPNSAFAKFAIAGESFVLMDGLFGLALQKRVCGSSANLVYPNSLNDVDNRLLYFHSLAANTENAVPVNVLNNAELWQTNPNAVATSFKTIGVRNGQTPAQAMDSNGNLWFVLLNPIALVCWDSTTPYNRDNIKVVVRDDVTLQFASGLKVIKNTFGQDEIWTSTIRFQKISAETINPNEVNFRFQTRLIAALLGGGTRCTGIPLSRFV